MIKYCLFFLMLLGLVKAADIEVNTYDEFANGFNNVIQINKDEDVVSARVFFKDSRVNNYQVYTKMTCTNNGCFTKLPLTKQDLMSLDYTVVYKYDDGEISLSQEYTINKKEILLLPKVQRRFRKEKVSVYSEYQVPPANVKGFGSKLEILPTSRNNIWGVDAVFYSYYEINNAPVEKIVVCEKCKHDNNEDVIKIEKDHLKYGAGALFFFLLL